MSLYCTGVTVLYRGGCVVSLWLFLPSLFCAIYFRHFDIKSDQIPDVSVLYVPMRYGFISVFSDHLDEEQFTDELELLGLAWGYRAKCAP